MKFQGKVQKANKHGSKRITVPKHVVGPDGDEIEIGDTVTVRVEDVEKQGERE